MNENPYASPERVEDRQENPMLDMMLGNSRRDEMMEMLRIRQGLRLTWCRGVMWLLVMLCTLLNAGLAKMKVDGDIVPLLALGNTLFSFLGGVLALFALAYLWWGLAEAEPGAHWDMIVSWLCAVSGTLLTVAMVFVEVALLGLVGLSLLCIGYWKWSRCLEFVAWKVKRGDLMQRSLWVGALAIGWFGMVLLALLLLVFLSRFSVSADGLVMLVEGMMLMAGVLGCAYFVAELTLVWKLIGRLGRMLRAGDGIEEVDW